MFADRLDAGERLAAKLEKFSGTDPLILAVPRGGVVVAYQIAKRLNAELDIVVPRKLGAPGNPELAIGAVAQDSSIVIDEDIVRYLDVSDSYITEQLQEQTKEIERRMKRYRGEKPLPSMKNRTLILVDDGIATGATMRASIQFVRKNKPKHVVVAVPVGPPETLGRLRGEADEVVYVEAPQFFSAIGQCYADFEQTTDEVVVDLLEKARQFTEAFHGKLDG